MIKTIYLFMSTIFLLYSCSSDDSINQEPNPEPVANTVKLVNNSVHGKILTDSEGKSLYFFSKDSNGESACLDGCIAVWPIFNPDKLTLGEGLDALDFGEITRADGKKQTTYKGWPLYYFANDNVVGDTKGDGITDNWYIAKPDYSLMYVQAQLVGKADGGDVNFKSDYTPGDELTFYISDSEGNTLYTFKNDRKDKNNFTAADFSNNGVWPIFHIDIDRLPSILDPNDFGTIDIFGNAQLTYRGSPLYYFGQDSARGDNFGISFPAPGVWPIANTDNQIAPEN